MASRIAARSTTAGTPVKSCNPFTSPSGGRSKTVKSLNQFQQPKCKREDQIQNSQPHIPRTTHVAVSGKAETKLPVELLEQA